MNIGMNRGAGRVTSRVCGGGLSKNQQETWRNHILS